MIRRQYKVGTFPNNLLIAGQKWLILLSIILISLDFSNSSITCGPGIYSPGGTTPSGDVNIEYNSGTPLEITCNLNPNHELLQKILSDETADDSKSKLLSQKIMFYKNDERVAKQYVSIINSTAAQLRVSNLSASSDVYTCMVCLDKNNHGIKLSKAADISSINMALRNSIMNTVGYRPNESVDTDIGVCLNNVNVGYKPLNVTNFACTSNNWESLSCNWTKPENPIKTAYKVYFRLAGRAFSRSFTACPADSDVRDNSCYWDFSTTPLYRQSYEYYYFTITGENALGKSSMPIRFHHYANIIPARPTKIAAIDQTESSVKLTWSIGTMSFYSHGIVYKIQYKSQWDSNPEQWHTIIVNDKCNPQSTSHETDSAQNTDCVEHDGDHHYYDVTGLKYPFARYDFRISLRTALAGGDDKWSAPGYITVNTKPTIPKRPPQTDIGSFQCVPSPSDKSKRDVLVYWQTIEDNEKCGESFEYIAYYVYKTEDEQTITRRSDETYKNYAKFNCLSTSIGYEFIVVSYNKEGFSTECSKVYVPSESDTLDKPTSLKKSVFDKQGIFELSWKGADVQKSSTPNPLDYYTLFWCEKDIVHPQQCNGYMNWMHVPISVSRYNTTVFDNMEKYIFSISANSENPSRNGLDNLKASSSGMVWESFDDNVKNVWVSVIGPTFAGLSWKVYCDDKTGLIIGYHVFHCPIISIKNPLCKEPMVMKTVNEFHPDDCKGSILVSNLKPYTEYLVVIAIVTDNDQTLNFDITIKTLRGSILK
ncbi:cytokine receptor-like [Rhopalosiphum padi]|uniref:cytokine receptor-like n=1 Tax=Rhopalosiphum padi TaxID=40932 RepID=UPI00298E9BCE|nr:cytokine receptor-like [Rhopalosiphum padi]